VGRTWLRAPGTRDDSACAMARNAARKRTLRIRLATRGWRFGAWLPAKRRFASLDFARYAPRPGRIHTGTDILTFFEKVVASPNIPHNYNCAFSQVCSVERRDTFILCLNLPKIILREYHLFSCYIDKNILIYRCCNIRKLIKISLKI